MSRKEIINKISTKDGGGFNRAIEDLESSSFLRTYKYFGKNKRDTTFQLIDPFTLFYHKHISKNSHVENYWLSQINTPSMNVWMGYAFEMIFFLHVNQVKNTLGISGVSTEISSWRGSHAQVDLIIDRQDKVINLIEIKFSIDVFQITKSYDKILRTKVSEFIAYAKTKKAVWLTMITTFGLTDNMYSGNVQKVITLDRLFDE